MNIFKQFKFLSRDTSASKFIFSLLSKNDKYIIFLHLSLQIILSLIDLVGMFLIGLMASISVSGIGGDEPNAIVNKLLKLVNIEQSTIQFQTLIIGIAASVVLILRTLISSVVTYSTLKFLGNKSRQISSKLLNQLLSAGLQKIEKFSIPEIVFMLTNGVSKLVVGGVGQSIQIISDSILLIVILCGLVLFDPLIATLTLGIFVIVSLVMYLQLSGKSKMLGKENYELGIEAENLIHSTVFLFKEIFVRNTLLYFFNKIVSVQSKSANNFVKIAFLPTIGKYIFELTLIVGGLFIGCLQLIIHDSVQAATSISIFLVAALRIAPAILRIQQNTIQIQESLTVAHLTRRMIDELKDLDLLTLNLDDNQKIQKEFEPTISINRVSFRYPNSSYINLQNISLEVSKGKQVAIIGPSGAGKTTLLNLILGLIQPDIGEIAISGKSPKDAFRTWPGAVSYVPQNIYVFAGSLEANLRIGLTSENIKEIDMIRVLKTAELDKFLQDHEKTLDFQVESGGTNLSGGEKQRVAIARALLTSPKLLVLDEVTSSLDYNTEANFTQTLKELKGKITVLIVAHRLSTVKNADLIIYLDKGKIRAIGNLEDIKKVIPNFEIAANLSNK